MRVAIVHDYLTQFGGAERVLTRLLEAFPNAPVFTLVHSAKEQQGMEEKWRLRSSFLQKFSLAQRYHHYFPMLMPLAAEAFDAREFDVVLSASHSFGKGIITGPNTLHICYCFTPTRYLWDDSHRYVREFSSLPGLSKLAPIGLSYLRLWDYYAAQRVDHYITSSSFVAQRIARYYGREAAVLAPPIDYDLFAQAVATPKQDHYLVVARLLPYKRVNLAIEAATKLGKKLKIVGTGPEEKKLRAMAGDNVEFLGFVPDHQLPKLYAQAQALLFPQEEDFGLTPLEAAAAGTPTIAFASGGATETVALGVSGHFFSKQTAESLAQAILEFEAKGKDYWDREKISQHAQGWKQDDFVRDIKNIIELHWHRYAQLPKTPTGR